MKKILVNLIINTASLVVFMALLTTGLIMKFILPAGSGRLEMLLRGGRGAHRTIDVFMNLTRHEWGDIHFYLALTFLVLLVVHLILHWDWIVRQSFGTKDYPQPVHRKILAFGVIVAILFLLVFPWMAGKETVTRSEIQRIRKIPDTLQGASIPFKI